MGNIGRRRGDFLRELLLPARSVLTSEPFASLYRAAGGPVATALAYYAGAMIAFLVGTFSDQIYAPFWPPNVILFGALAIAPRRRWPVYLAAVIPAHILAEMWVAMPAEQMIVAYLTNSAAAIIAALIFRYRGSSRLLELPDGMIRIVVVAALAPAVAGFGGALVRILGGGMPGEYWDFWLQWYVGNALAFLTLGPTIVAWLGRRRSAPLTTQRVVEAGVVSFCLVVACIASMRLGPHLEETGLLPAILYLPLPFVLWASARFGEMGASVGVLIITIVSIGTALDGPSVFFSATTEGTVLALQLYLIGIAITVLPLGAAVDELHFAQRKTRWLARSLLDARDEERRRIARELHDSTGQNLVAASMIVDQIASTTEPSSNFETLRVALRQSIREIRTLSYLLHPPLLDEGGLRLALENFVEGYVERTGIAIDMDISIDEGRLPKGTELILFRVVQEALMNVSRHSESPSASVTLGQRRAGRVGELLIEDFGKGFVDDAGTPQDPAKISGGVGLSSIRERLLQIGGQLDINSRPGSTVLYATFPIERRAPRNLRAARRP